MVLDIISILSLGIVLLYSILIIYYLIGWLKLKVVNITSKTIDIEVNVVISFRNEEKNIHSLIESLKDQNYDESCVKYILVDDHSNDNSYKIAVDLIKGNHSFIILTLDENQNGKKAALSKALSYCNGEVVLFTDADCEMSQSWISDMVSYYKETNADMVLAPVAFKHIGKLISKFSEFEFVALMMSTGGSAFYGNPVMSNGANMLIRRDALIGQKDFYNTEFASGDDIFLMLKLKKEKKIVFNRSVDASISTDPPMSISSFINQRLRWVSKNRGISDFYIKRDSLLVYFTNLVVLLNLILGINYLQSLFVFLLLYVVKSIIDGVFVSYGLRFFQKKGLMKYLFIFQIFNFLYVPIVGIFGMLGSFSWKGRRYKK